MHRIQHVRMPVKQFDPGRDMTRLVKSLRRNFVCEENATERNNCKQDDYNRNQVSASQMSSRHLEFMFRGHCRLWGGKQFVLSILIAA
jgi:hypothetical protein